MRTLAVLQRHKKMVARRMPATTEIIKGTLIEMARVCGKPNCKCTEGEKHRCLCVSRYVNGKSRMVYVPVILERRIRECVENYHRIKRGIHELTELNLELMKRER